ncbi:hypothetical protein D915_007894 [Fasciola hepatica]|uniref:Ig-like domain-containing protein n=1 Tax=Fasciola hepatica TaxID=6192 RepID=A0A4E0R476_FASHE|nr:hypothetical protein D915_007894 [Fasciola hepatica]
MRSTLLVLFSFALFTGLSANISDLQITYVIENDSVDLECPVPDERQTSRWTHNNMEVAEETHSFTFSGNAAALSIRSVNQQDAGIFACLDQNETQVRRFWVVVLKDFHPTTRNVNYVVKYGDTIKLHCCLKYPGIMDTKYWRQEYTLRDSSERHFRTTSEWGTAELYDFNSATVGKFGCGGQLGRRNWERTFNVVEGTKTMIYRPECHMINWDIRSAHQAVDLIGSVKFGDSYLTYHPRLNVIATNDRVTLQQVLVNYLHKIRRDWQLQDEFPMGINLIEVHPIMHEVVLRVVVGNDHIKTFGFAGITDRVIKLTESLFYDNGTHGLSYRFRKYSTDESEKIAYQIAFIGGQLIEGIKKYAYGAQFEDPRLEAYRDLNRTVCTHIEKWRQNDVKFRTCPVYCTVYAMDLDSVVVTQLSIFNHHLVQADIDADENAVLNEIASWLSRVETKIGIIEYKPRVFKSSVKALGKVYKNNNPMEYAAEFNDPKSSEFAILKQQLTAYVNWFVPKERHIMQSSECDLIAFDPEQNVVKTKLFGNNKELLRAGLVIQRNYPEFLSRQTDREEDPFKYEIFKIERETVKNRKEIVLIYTMELKQYIPVNPKSLHKLCKNISVRIIDKKKSEYLAQECNVLDFNLEDSTITVSIKLFSDHVQYYSVDLDDLEVLWEE